jgi:hypothetical protein
MIWLFIIAYYVGSVCYFLSQMGYKNRKDKWYDWILFAPTFSIILVLWLPLRWGEVRRNETSWRCIFGGHDMKKMTVHHVEGEKVWIRCHDCGEQEIIQRAK